MTSVAEGLSCSLSKKLFIRPSFFKITSLLLTNDLFFLAILLIATSTNEPGLTFNSFLNALSWLIKFIIFSTSLIYLSFLIIFNPFQIQFRNQVHYLSFHHHLDLHHLHLVYHLRLYPDQLNHLYHHHPYHYLCH